ncbi:hypothetical protein KID03_05850 [bacterium]|uniref:DNA polymerase III subunit delta n=1 Tax=Candidatus Scatenecus faecavium TaxID=2840915 RepID=A0A9D1FU73_9BACT|nr:hypothetical protein [bacterium]HIS82003.1 hypothetical protein [Candidatus Scatenecus faecavium]
MLSCNNAREQYPKLIEYFESGINNPDKNIAHCILLYGNDLNAQYEVALEAARMLNCKGSHTPDCDCLNCRWIRENNHPEVRTISKVDNKPSDDDAKTVISIAQARMIKNDLLITSEYHRVLIFCDKEKDGSIAPLNMINFPEAAANALLKTFEEPPSGTTFFFLTRDKSDVITTVLSRAQSFFVPSKLEENRDFSLVKETMDFFLEIERGQVLDFNEKLLALTTDNEPLEVLTQMQNYLGAVLKSPDLNRVQKYKFIKQIKTIEAAKKQLGVNMNLQTVLENLSFNLVL